MTGKAATPTGEGGRPWVTVVVPTFQRRDLALRAIDSLLAQTVPEGTLEIVVVVDGTTDDTAPRLRALRHPHLRVLEQDNRGRAAALNAGARIGRGSILLFLDDDMRADPRMLEEHLRAYAELDAHAVMGLIEHDAASPVNVISEEVRREFDRDAGDWGGTFGLLPEGRPLVAAQFSVRRDLFDSIGGFDESFTSRGRFGHADDDLGIRLRAAGARIARNGRAVSYQMFVRSFDSVWRQYEQYGEADVRLARKHPGDHGRLWALPDPGTASRAVALATLRYPEVARWVGDLIRPTARAIYRRGNGALVRKVTYTLLFDHRYWLGVVTAGGGPDVGVRPARRGLLLAYRGVGALVWRSVRGRLGALRARAARSGAAGSAGRPPTGARASRGPRSG